MSNEHLSTPLSADRKIYVEQMVLVLSKSQADALSYPLDSDGLRSGLIRSLRQTTNYFSAHLGKINANAPFDLARAPAIFEDAIYALEAEITVRLSGEVLERVTKSLSWLNPSGGDARRLFCDQVALFRRPPPIGGRESTLVDASSGMFAIAACQLGYCISKCASGLSNDLLLIVLEAHRISHQALWQSMQRQRTATEERRLKRLLHEQIGRDIRSIRAKKQEELRVFAGQLIQELAESGASQKSAIVGAYDLVRAKADALGVSFSADRYLNGPTGKEWHNQYRRNNNLRVGPQGRKSQK